MKIIFLGTAGYHPTEKRQTTCIMIPELGMVLDAGTGFFRVKDHLQTDYLNIFLSHAHLDHSVGLTYLLDVVGDKFPMENVNIYGIKEHLDKIKNELFQTHFFSIPPQMNFIPLDITKPALIKGVEVMDRENIHPGRSVSYRFTFPNGKSIAYMTDLTSDDSYIPFAKNADLLIHECYFSDKEKDKAIKTGHSWTSLAHKIARDGGVKKLALMHFNPLDVRNDPTDQASAEISFPALVPNDGEACGV